MDGERKDGGASCYNEDHDTDMLARKRRIFRWLYPLFDALSSPWPSMLVSIGMVIPLFQSLALVANPVYPWGPVLRAISLPIYFTLLPFWDKDYFAHASFTVNSIFFWILFGVLAVLTILLVHYARQLHHVRYPSVPAVVRVCLHLIIGPLFLPCLHLLLSVTVCRVETTVDAAGTTTSTRRVLSAFRDTSCFDGAVYPTVVFAFAIVTLVLLVAPKTIITFFVYDDHPLTGSPRGRPHNVVEGWVLVAELTSAVLYHYLPSVGQRETFAGLLAASSGVLAGAHCFYLPFLNGFANQMRVVGLASVSYCSLVMVVVLSIGAKTTLYTGTNDWDCLVILAGLALVWVVASQMASWRVSRSFLRDVVRAQHSITLGAQAAYGRMGRRAWRFPHYLPHEERAELGEKDILALAERPRELESTGPSHSGSLLFGCHDSPSSQPVLTDGNDTGTAAQLLLRLGVEGDYGAMDGMTLSSYIDAVYTETDVEVATRFLPQLIKCTSLHPSARALGFAARIYAKGISRFPASDWLKLQYASFLSTYTSHLNETSVAICDELARRELGFATAYRLHRHLRAAQETFMQHDRLSRRAFHDALAIHKETLTHVSNFWKQLELDQIGVSQLGRIAFAVMDGCTTGMKRYVQALKPHVDAQGLIRYAQFLDHIALDKDAADNVREMTLDFVEKRQAGLLGETPSLAFREPKSIGKHFHHVSRSLRYVLLCLCVLVIAFIAVVLAELVTTHQTDMLLLERSYYASLCRFYTLRTLWSANLAMSSANTASIWASLRRDLTSLRNANEAVTYRANSRALSGTGDLMKSPLYVLYYGHTSSFEETGMWRAGEVYLSAVETLVLARSSTVERSTAYQVLSTNELSGAAAAYNASLVAFMQEAAHELSTSTYVVIAMYIATLCTLLVAFFVLRYCLSRIGGTRLSVLGLFRLIPRSALKTMIATMNERVDTFDGPDLAFQQMLSDRGLPLDPDAAVSRANKPFSRDSKRTGSTPNGPAWGANAPAVDAASPEYLEDSSSVADTDRDTGVLSSRPSARDLKGMHELAKKPSIRVPLMTHGRNGAQTAGSGPGLTANFGSFRSRHAAVASGTGSINSVGAAGGAGYPTSSVGSDQSPLYSNSGGVTPGGHARSADLFARLARSSSVADVGRLNFHQGQYEPPYREDAFTARVLSPEEEIAHQREIDNSVVDELLAHSKNARIGRGAQAAAGVGEEESSSTNRITENDIHRSMMTVRTSAKKYQTLLTVFGAISVVLAFASGVFALLRCQLVLTDVESRYSLIRALQAKTRADVAMLDAAEAVVFDPSAAQSMTNLLQELKESRLVDISAAGIANPLRSPALTSYLGIADLRFHQVYDQAMIAAYLSCLGADDASDLPCAYLSDMNWSRMTFLPTTADSVTFNATRTLPQGKDSDLLASPAEKRVIAFDIISSPYYEYLKDLMHTNILAAKSTVEKEMLEEITNGVTQNKTEKYFLVLCTSLLAASMTATFLVAVIGFPDRKALTIVLLLCTALVYVSLVLACLLYARDLPQDGPYSSSVDHYTAAGTVEASEYYARENAKRSGFAASEVGAVNYDVLPDAVQDAAWVQLFNMIGGRYVQRLEASYGAFQYCRFLNSLVVVLSCQYNHFDDAICTLPRLQDFNWDITEEASGERTVLQYHGTTQLLYTNRTYDMNALTAAEQKALALSLAFGVLYERTYNFAVTELTNILQDFTDEKVSTVTTQRAEQLPMAVAATVFDFVVSGATLCTVLLLALVLAEDRHTQTGLRTTAGSSVSATVSSDNSFRRLIRHTALALGGFTVLFSVLFAVTVYSYQSPRFGDDTLNIATLLNAQLVESGVNLDQSTKDSWEVYSANQFAVESVQTAERFYRATSFNFDEDTIAQVFGPTKVLLTRYNANTATNVTTVGFTTQSSVLAFGGLVDLSQRRWRQRVSTITLTDQSMRADQTEELYSELFELTERARVSGRAIAESVEAHRRQWFKVELILLILTLVAFLAVTWYLLFPVVQRLMKEEEGTQVMLCMIPLHLRKRVPAIAEFVATGRIVQDANIAEVDAMATHLSVLPTLAINTQGIITHFSRAAEEQFQWTAAEVIGQNVSVLMPENIAVEHNHYLQRYLHSKMSSSMVSHRTVRARRKDGSLFPASVQVREVRACEMDRTGANNVVAFVGVVRSCQDDLEFDRTCRLVASLTESIMVPVIVSDVNGVISKFSKAAELAFKCSASEVIGRKINVLMPRAEADVHDRYMANYIRNEGGRALNLFRFIHAKRLNGEIFPAQLLVREVRFGGSVHLVAYVQDMSERLHLEMLAAAASTTKAVSPTPLVIADAEGRIVFCSQSVCRLFGYSTEELLNQSLSMLMEEPLASQHRNYYAAFVRRSRGAVRGTRLKAADATEQRSGQEERRVTYGTARRREEDGSFSTFAVRVTVSGFFLESKGTHVLAFIENISARRALQTKHSISRAVVEFSATPAVLVSADGSIVMTNAATHETFGRAAAELYGMPVRTLFRPAPFVDPAAATRGAGVDDSDGASMNPVDAALEEFRKTGTSPLLGRSLRAWALRYGAAKTPLSGGAVAAGATISSPDGQLVAFPVDVLVKEVPQGGEESDAAFLVQFHDASEDTQLLEVAKYTHALFSTSTVPIVCASLTEGVLFACSDATCRRFGWKREDLIGQHIRVLVHHPAHTRAANREDAANTAAGHSSSGNENLRRLFQALSKVRPLRRGGSFSSRVDAKQQQQQQGQASSAASSVAKASAVVASPNTVVSTNDEEVILTGCTSDGKEFPMSVKVQVVEISGSPPFFVASMRNCAADMSLLGQKNMSGALSDLSPVPFICITATGEITEFSLAAEERFGYKANEILGRNVRTLMSGDIGVRHDGFLRSYVKTRVRRVVDSTTSVMARRKDGTFFRAELFVREVVYRNSKTGREMIEFVSYSCDTTETTTLRKTLKIKDAVAALTSVAMIEATLDGAIVRYNDTAAEEFGYLLPEGDSSEEPFLARRRSSQVLTSLFTLFPPLLRDDVELVVTQGDWLAKATRELDRLCQRQHRARTPQPLDALLSGATPDENTPENEGLRYDDGTRPTMDAVYRCRLLGRRADGSSFRCDVSVQYGIQRPASAQPEQPSSSSVLPADDEVDQKDQRGRTVVVRVENLTSDFKLQLQQELIASTTAVMSTPVLHIDVNGRILSTNNALEGLLDYSAAELLHRSVLELMPPDAEEQCEQLLLRFQLTGVKTYADADPTSADYTPLSLQLLRRGGAVVLVHVAVQEVTGVAGDSSFLCSLADLSKPMASGAEDAMRAALTCEAPVAVIATDHTGVVTECTARAEALLRYTAGELVGKPISLIKACPLAFHAGDEADATNSADFFAANMTYRERGDDKNSREGQSMTESVRDRVSITCGDATTVRAEVRIFPALSTRSHGPQSLQFVAYIEDIGHLLDIEPKVEEARRVLTTSPAGVLVLSLSGVVEHFNPAALQLLHWTPSTLSRKPLLQLLAEGSLPAHGLSDLDDSATDLRDSRDDVHNSAASLLAAVAELAALASTSPQLSQSAGAGLPHQDPSAMTSTRPTGRSRATARIMTVDDSHAPAMTVHGVALRRGDGSGQVLVDATLTLTACVPLIAEGSHRGSNLTSDAANVAADPWDAADSAPQPPSLSRQSIVVTLCDVGEHYLLTELQRKELLLEGVSLTAMVELDADGSILHMSSNLAQRLGYCPETDLVGRPYSDLFLKGDSRIAKYMHLAKTSATAQVSQLRVEQEHQHIFYLRDKNGTTRRKMGTLHSTASPDGALLSVVAVLTLPRSIASWLSQLGLPTMSLTTEAMLLVTCPCNGGDEEAAGHDGSRPSASTDSGSSSQRSGGGVVVCSNQAADELFSVPGDGTLIGLSVDSLFVLKASAASPTVTAPSPLHRNGRAAALAGAQGSPSAPVTVTSYLHRHANGRRRVLTMRAVRYPQQQQQQQGVGAPDAPPGTREDRARDGRPSVTRVTYSPDSDDASAAAELINSPTSTELHVPVEVSVRELSQDVHQDSHNAAAPMDVQPAQLMLVHIHSVAEEQKLELRQRAIDTALECSFSATVIIDAAGSITVFSRVAEKMFGLTKEAAQGCAVAELLLEPSHAAALRKLLAELRQTQKDGSSVPRMVLARRYGSSPEPGQPGPAVGVLELELMIDRVVLSEPTPQYAYTLYFSEK